MVKSAELGVSIKYIQSATDDGPLKYIQSAADDGLSTKAIFALIGLTLKKTIREKIINLDTFIYSTVTECSKGV